LILPSKETIERKKLDDRLNELNIVLNPVLELESNQMMINYINEGLGIGYILKSVALQNKDLTILELDEELPNEEIRLIYDEESIITSTKEFISLLKQNI
jgi:DNA-binding transcriptional LysR family regulator